LERLFGLKSEWQGIATVDALEGRLAFSVVRAPRPVGTPRPDGSGPFRRFGSVYFYDLNARQEIAEIVGTEDNPLAEGVLRWRADGTGVNLHSYTYSERPGPSSGIFLDGTMRLYDVQAWTYLSPEGTRMVHGIVSRCMAIAGPDMYVRNLDTGQDVIAIHNGNRLFTGLDWSPDGREFLFQSRTTVDGPECQPLPEPIYLVMNASTGLVSPVQDLETLYRRWYGSDVLWLECQDRFEPFYAGYLGFRTALCLDSASQGFVPGTLRYRDLEIESGSSFRLYGIVP
jgi:hypothetical protein